MAGVLTGIRLFLMPEPFPGKIGNFRCEHIRIFHKTFPDFNLLFIRVFFKPGLSRDYQRQVPRTQRKHIHAQSLSVVPERGVISVHTFHSHGHRTYRKCALFLIKIHTVAVNRNGDVFTGGGKETVVVDTGEHGFEMGKRGFFDRRQHITQFGIGKDRQFRCEFRIIDIVDFHCDPPFSSLCERIENRGSRIFRNVRLPPGVYECISCILIRRREG